MEHGPSIGEVTIELHSDLARKYKKHVAAIDSIWRSFTKAQRKSTLKAGATEGSILKHAQDTSLGNVYKFVPEYNFRDIVDSGPDFLLNLLEYRATTELQRQYFLGPNGKLGDKSFIEDMMQRKNLRHVDLFKNELTCFMDEYYGKSFIVQSHHDEIQEAFGDAFAAGLMVPRSTGELILTRQNSLLQVLNILIDDILDQGSTTRITTQRTQKKKAASSTTTALTMPIQHAAKTTKLDVSDISAYVEAERQAAEDNLGLLSQEPMVLAHAVNVQFYTRPEMIADEKGRSMGTHTDKYISSAFFEAVHEAVKVESVWKYIGRLLQLLETATSKDKAYKALILQEIANLSHLEFGRAQAGLKRQVQAMTGIKWFRRASGVYDKTGNPRVSMKGKPEDLTRSDPQLHYVLRLCHPDTNATAALGWVEKLGDLYGSHEDERDKLTETESDALCYLAFVIGFIQDLTASSVAVPALSRKKGQTFITRLLDLEAELNLLRNKIDIRDLIAPVDNLLEPGVAEEAIKTLDQFVAEHAGVKLEVLYDDLVEECLAHLESQNEKAKAKQQQQNSNVLNQPYINGSATTLPGPRKNIVEQRRQKEKTRPPHSSFFKLSLGKEPAGGDGPADKETTPKFKVSAATAAVFAMLFDKSQARGSINWDAFQAALAELEFTLMPRFGSVYTFYPPESMGLKKSLTVHRPHRSRIEGYRIPILAYRLQRTFGWGNDTFEAK